MALRSGEEPLRGLAVRAGCGGGNPAQAVVDGEEVFRRFVGSCTLGVREARFVAAEEEAGWCAAWGERGSLADGNECGLGGGDDGWHIAVRVGIAGVWRGGTSSSVTEGCAVVGLGRFGRSKGPGFRRCRVGLVGGVGGTVCVLAGVWRFAEFRLRGAVVVGRGGVRGVMCSVLCAWCVHNFRFCCFHSIGLSFSEVGSGIGKSSCAIPRSCSLGNARQKAELDTASAKRDCACAANLTKTCRCGSAGDADEVCGKAFATPDKEGGIGGRDAVGDAGGEKEILLAAGKLANRGTEVSLDDGVEEMDALTAGEGLTGKEVFGEVSVFDARGARGAGE